MRGIVRRWVGESRTVEPVTANDLLARTDRDGGDAHVAGDDVVRFDDVHVPARMLADLHDPRLVITLDYVGPERGLSVGRGRATTHKKPDCRRAGQRRSSARRRRPGTTSHTPIRPLVVAVAVTTATVVPLTIALTQWIVH